MEKFQIKCGSCGKTMQVSTEVLAPYSGKTIRITSESGLQSSSEPESPGF
jgi:C4-type Zn-finger protein